VLVETAAPKSAPFFVCRHCIRGGPRVARPQHGNSGSMKAGAVQPVQDCPSNAVAGRSIVRVVWADGEFDTAMALATTAVLDW